MARHAHQLRERGSSVVEYALLMAMVAAILAASVLMYRTVNFNVGIYPTPTNSVQQQEK